MLYQALIAIIIIALILYLIMILMQRNLVKRIQKLNSRENSLTRLPIDRKIDTIKKMKLSGSSLATLDKWTKEYDDLHANSFKQIDDYLSTAHHATTKFRFITARSQINHAVQAMDTLETSLKKIADGLQSIQVDQTDSTKELKQLTDDYHRARKQVLVKSFTYGATLDKLEKMLAEIERNLTQINELTKDGDYQEAKRAISKASTKNKDLQQLIKEIPALVNEQTNEFTAQLAELKAGYREMSENHFQFMDIDIPAKIRELDELLAKAKQQLVDLHLEEATALNHEIADAIDQLYAVMEREYSAKAEVNKQMPYILSFIEHASRQSHTLKVELNRLNQSYDLNNNEIGKAKQLAQQIEDIKQQYETDKQEITNGNPVYTNIQEDLRAMENHLTEIEKAQKEINDSTAKLRHAEEVAVDSAQQFEQELYNVKRTVERQNLPGLASDYLNFFFMVADEIDKLNADLDQTRVNMDDITKQLIMTQEDLNSLKEKSNDLIDSALLTEQLLQYANRYRHSHPDVQAAINQADELFNKKYSYKTAVDILATALDKVEPGAYQKVEKSYFDNKDGNMIL